MKKIELQILWLENSLGIAINQRLTNHTIPLISYYFWPVSEAWELIGFELDSKFWIPEKERIKILNLVVDIMNYWQINRSTPNPLLFKEEQFLNSDIVVTGFL